MSSFLEKLKKGMGVKEAPMEKEPEESEKKPKPVKEKKPARKAPVEKKKARKPEPEPESKDVTGDIEGEKPLPHPPKKEVKEEVKEEKITMPKEEKKKIEVKDTSPLIPEKKEKTEKKQETSPSSETAESEGKNWLESEGQLAVDVYQTDGEIVIQSAVAGVKPEELDISIENDLVTIKGNREKPTEKEEKNYFYQECYWGRFSREIILPAEVDGGRTSASMKEGVLTIRIPKIEREKKRKIVIKE
jgi:HSP20 family protein